MKDIEKELEKIKEKYKELFSTEFMMEWADKEVNSYASAPLGMDNLLFLMEMFTLEAVHLLKYDKEALGEYIHFLYVFADLLSDAYIMKQDLNPDILYIETKQRQANMWKTFKQTMETIEKREKEKDLINVLDDKV